MDATDLSYAVWRKSSRSGHDGGDCVEVASLQGAVAVRDSKDWSGAGCQGDDLLGGEGGCGVVGEA
ncbi:DUF397 domain-containing protein [Thermopolyspora sp. NPDC052614]|uniref:DUF397 domain-containing protein n=1 Tax=Thermopolyspora sp. NPDC052614 TaxID=3155682 RepID=UPI0034497E11